MSWLREFDGFKDLLASTDKVSLAQTKKNPLAPTEYRESMKLKADTGINLFHLSFVDKYFIQVLSPIKEVYMSDDEVEALTAMYTFLHKEDTVVYVPKLSGPFHSCYCMIRNLTPGIQEVKGLPVYLPMVWCKWFGHSFSGSVPR